MTACVSVLHQLMWCLPCMDIQKIFVIYDEEYLSQGLANFFWKGLYIKYFNFCGLYSLCQNYSLCCSLKTVMDNL